MYLLVLPIVLNLLAVRIVLPRENQTARARVEQRNSEFLKHSFKCKSRQTDTQTDRQTTTG